jgi:hypothetical protein
LIINNSSINFSGGTGVGSGDVGHDGRSTIEQIVIVTSYVIAAGVNGQGSGLGSGCA